MGATVGQAAGSSISILGPWSRTPASGLRTAPEPCMAASGTVGPRDALCTQSRVCVEVTQVGVSGAWSELMCSLPGRQGAPPLCPHLRACLTSEGQGRQLGHTSLCRSVGVGSSCALGGALLCPVERKACGVCRTDLEELVTLLRWPR